jgi:hypothetical protein
VKYRALLEILEDDGTDCGCVIGDVRDSPRRAVRNLLREHCGPLREDKSLTWLADQAAELRRSMRRLG